MTLKYLKRERKKTPTEQTLWYQSRRGACFVDCTNIKMFFVAVYSEIRLNALFRAV